MKRFLLGMFLALSFPCFAQVVSQPPRPDQNQRGTMYQVGAPPSWLCYGPSNANGTVGALYVDITPVTGQVYSCQNDGSWLVIGSSASVTFPITVAQGGTGATTAAAALTALGAAPIASPTFTGIAAVPTAGVATATSQVANTLFVHEVILKGTLATIISATTATLTVTNLAAAGVCVYSPSDVNGVAAGGSNIVSSAVTTGTFTLTFAVAPTAVGHFSVVCSN